MLRGRRQTYLVALETKVLSQGNLCLNTSDRIEQGCFVTGSLQNPVYETLCMRCDTFQHKVPASKRESLL